jgi:hypothetical protein
MKGVKKVSVLSIDCAEKPHLLKNALRKTLSKPRWVTERIASVEGIWKGVSLLPIFF